MSKLSRVLTFLVATALPIMALNCVSCGTAQRAAFESPYAATSDRDAARVQGLALSVVEVQVEQPLLMVMPVMKKGTRGGLGTGWVAQVSGGRSLVVTNEHVCNPGSDIEAPPGTVIMVGPSALKVMAVGGAMLDAKVVYADPATDFCALDVAGVAGAVAPLAASDPPAYGVVERIGDDMGIIQPGVVPYHSGRWIGRLHGPHGETKAIVSAIASHGASGSPVFYRGQVVAMVVAVPTEPVGSFTWCVPLDDIRAGLSKALPAWKK